VRVGKEIFVVVRQTPGANEPLAAIKPLDLVSLQWEPKAPRLGPQTSSIGRSS
jgi:putative spermidine/putrescine transport system ATP-binding protein